MSGIKFYSEYDLACTWELSKIAQRIRNNDIDNDWDFSDLIDFYNIIKYIQVERFCNYLNQETHIDIQEAKKSIKKKIGIFLGNCRNEYLNFYDEIEFSSKDDFFEIFINYKIYTAIDEGEFKKFLTKESVYIFTILKFRKIVELYNNAVKDKLLSDSKNAEIIISTMIGENDLHLPTSLIEKEILDIIKDYVQSSEANLNVLRKIITFPPDKGNIPDKIRLLAKREVTEREKTIFKNGAGIESSVSISYVDDQKDAILVQTVDAKADIKVNRGWIVDNLDYPTLWNNFIYIFNFVDMTMRLTLDSKRSESGVFESIISKKGKHIYNRNYSFSFKEMLSDVEVFSYSQVLSVYNLKIEDMIEWFFTDYLKAEFKIENFVVRMPSEEITYLQKCRTILPEIDIILKQYNLMVEEGIIDQELIQMSNSSVKYKDYKSFNEKKYVYPKGTWYRTATFLLFSDQSHIFYLRDKEEKHTNFYELIKSEDLNKNDFQDYQIRDMQWLFDNDIIHETEKGYIKFVDHIKVFILNELFHNEVLNYWRYPNKIREAIEMFYRQDIVTFESTLFSKNEQDYFNYYLNKSEFTNGLNIRNDYLHGTNPIDEKQHKIDYYRILKLIVLIVIKINDDLCIKDDNSCSYQEN
ncbi:hypothetical protein [Clostridium sp. VAP51]|uniref:hypothetical protein n=1 Tax=Clostridium sp. VAP51 TaxID=2949978 RepID=UPI0020795F45|nr:hypothetical protein [Clostridium sp. VAP51]